LEIYGRDEFLPMVFQQRVALHRVQNKKPNTESIVLGENYGMNQKN
jgi:hypothetical protein